MILVLLCVIFAVSTFMTVTASAATTGNEDPEITGTSTANGDTKVTANPTMLDRFTYDKASDKNKVEGTIKGDGSPVLKLYNTKNSYKVIYYVDEEQKFVDTYKYGDRVTLRDIPSKEGYTFSGWQHPDNFTMPNHDVTLRGTFHINSYAYTVNYYYDNSLADDETVNKSAEFNSTAKAEAPDTKEKDGKNYMLMDIGKAYEIVIGTNEDLNVINVYYVLDENGPGGTPDGIPDSEEYNITYNANAQNATGETVDNAIYPVDYQVPLKENGFVNEDFVFDGWSNNADSQNIYQPDGSIRMVEGGLVMNAQWSKTPVTPEGTTPDGTMPGGTPHSVEFAQDVGKAPSGKSASGVKTGDETNLTVWLILALISGAAGMYVRRRKSAGI